MGDTAWPRGIGGGLSSVSGAVNTGPLTPGSLDTSHQEVRESFPDQATFTCSAAGSATIEYQVALSSTETTEASGTTSFTCREGPDATEQASGNPKPTKFKTLVSNTVGPVGGGDVEGDVQLVAAADGNPGTDIVIAVKGPADPLPVTLNEGGCDKRGALVQALSPTANGESTTRLPGALAGYLTGGYAVHVATPAKPDVDVACGVIARGRVIALGAGPDGDQTPADVVLVDQGPSGTEVSVFATPESVSAQQPLAIVNGSCGGSGTVAFTLTDARGGRSRTVVDVGFDELLSGGYSIRLGRSASQPDSIVACGNLSAG